MLPVLLKEKTLELFPLLLSLDPNKVEEKDILFTSKGLVTEYIDFVTKNKKYLDDSLITVIKCF